MLCGDLRVAGIVYLDRHIGDGHQFRSCRSGNGAGLPLAGVAFVHPQNERKRDIVEHMRLQAAIERCRTPPLAQRNSVDLCTSLNDWLHACSDLVRPEPFVVVICGHNVPPGRMLRCLHSLRRQQDFASSNEFGAIIIDDNSDSDLRELLRLTVAHDAVLRRRVSLFSQPAQARLLANTVFAVRQLCSHTEAVVLTLDLDDALVSDDVLLIVREHHQRRGADLTVGKVLRVDKSAGGALPISFVAPRFARGGGNVWQHLRTFCRQLFMALRDRDLRDENGAYYDLANDWAFMLPMAELARRPMAIDSVLYLHEPSTPRRAALRDNREAVIARIVSQTPYTRRHYSVAVVGYANTRQAPLAIDAERMAEEFGVLLGASGRYALVTGGLGGVMAAAAAGFQRAKAARFRELMTRRNTVDMAELWNVPVSIAVLPGTDPLTRNSFSDVGVPTGLEDARNRIVALSDCMVAFGGGAGTLSELALAWSARRLVLASANVGGTSASLAGRPLDHRRGDVVIAVQSAQEAFEQLEANVHRYNRRLTAITQ